MALFGSDFTQALRNAFETYKTVEDKELRETLQGRALVDALEFIRDELKAKREALRDAKNLTERKATELSRDLEVESDSARLFESTFENLQRFKERCSKELTKLKNQEHAKAGLRSGHGDAAEKLED